MQTFHINSNGVPSLCMKNSSGKCPFNLDVHFKSIDEAQQYADSMSEFAEGAHSEGYYKINSESNRRLKHFLTNENFADALSKGVSTDMSFNFQTNSINNAPIELDVIVSKDGCEYQVEGKLKEYLYKERDFDYKEEFEEYLKSKPDGIHRVNFKFNTYELLGILDKFNQIGNGRHESQSVGTIIYGIYLLTKKEVQ